MPSNSSLAEDLLQVRNSVYQPIHLQSSEEKLQVNNFKTFLEAASNYALYCLQQSLPSNVQLCTFDPMVWLPPELLEAVLGNLSVIDLLALACVNRQWKWYMSSHHAFRNASGSMSVDPACARLCKTNADWMVASRDAVAVNRALRMEGALIIKKIKVRDLAGYGLLVESALQECPDSMVAKDGVLCAGYHKRGYWIVHDTTYGKIWFLYIGSPITCYRFINASKSSRKPLQHIGMVFHGYADGTVQAPIGHSIHTTLQYRRHSGSVISCDADVETEVMASIGRDSFLRIYSMWSTAMLCAIRIKPCSSHVHVLKPHDGHFAVLVTHENGTFTKYSWPVTPGHPLESKTKIAELNPILDHSYENIYETFSKYGDFLNVKSTEFHIDHEVGEEVTHVVVEAESGTVGGVVIESNEKASVILVYDVHTLQLLLRLPVTVKVLRLMGAGRRFVLIVVGGSLHVEHRLVLVDMHKKTFVNSVPLQQASLSQPLALAHGCPSPHALDFSPVTEMRAARLEASHGGISTRYNQRRRRLVADGRSSSSNSDRVSLSLPVARGEGNSLLNIGPEQMEHISQLEDKTRSLDDSHLEEYCMNSILYTGYDAETQSFFYVTWNLLAGQKEPRRDKLKGE